MEISKPRIRVIVADDSATVRLGVKAMLATCPDFEVVGEARTGLDVLRLVDTRRPDLVLMDLRMPQMDGLEATQRIKSQRPHLPVVVLSLYRSLIDEAVAAGADASVLKGSPVEDLLSAIWRLASAPRDEDRRDRIG